MEEIDVEFYYEFPFSNTDCRIFSINEQDRDSTFKQPRLFVKLAKGDQILCLYKVYQTRSSCSDYFLYNEYHDWHSWIALGCGGYVHFVSKENFEVKSYILPDHFIEFYSTKNHFSTELDKNILLVASGDGLTLFNEVANKVWELEDLAVDGVIVHDVKKDTIFVSAQQDPPDGWADFEISLKDGTIIREPKYWFAKHII